MIKSLIGLFLWCAVLPISLFSQDCTCEANYEWVRSTFEENDAGFQYAIDAKGKDLYHKHCEQILSKVKDAKNSLECTQTLYAYLRFFRKGHIGIRRLNIGSSENESTEDIIKRYADWKSLSINLSEFKSRLADQQEPNFEGIWESAPYTIGIVQSDNGYTGWIIQADGVYWREGQVKLEIDCSDQDTVATFYMRDHSPQKSTKVELISMNHLQMGSISLKRSWPSYKDESEIGRYYDASNSDVPFVTDYSPTTCLLRIPSFSRSEKSKIDSVLRENHAIITQRKNLIIDLRKNGGGSDISYREVLPYLYSNPIRTIGVEYLSTPLNNQRMRQFIEDPNWSEDGKLWAKESLAKLEEQIGSFVLLEDNPTTTKVLDTIYPFPERVGILVDGSNGSTTEQFLLAAKQSTKVKLFGTTTYGILDISNMHFVNSPCAEFQLGYCLTRSLRIPDMTIDGKGLQPDYFLNDEIPPHKWVPFTEDILNAH